jgi:hypothetical protein
MIAHLPTKRAGVRSTDMAAGDGDDGSCVETVCGLKENRLILLGPWQEEDCARDERGGTASLHVTSRTWFDSLLASMLHNDIIQ